MSVGASSEAGIEFPKPNRDVRQVVQQTSLNYEGLEPLDSFHPRTSAQDTAGTAAGMARPIVIRVPWIATGCNAPSGVPQSPKPSTDRGSTTPVGSRVPLHCVYSTAEQGVECAPPPRVSEGDDRQRETLPSRWTPSPAPLSGLPAERQVPLPKLPAAEEPHLRGDTTHFATNRLGTEPHDSQQGTFPRAARVSPWDDTVTALDRLVKKYHRSLLSLVLLAVGVLMVLVFGHRTRSVEGTPDRFTTTAEVTSSRLRTVESDADMHFAPVEAEAEPPRGIALGPQGHAQRRNSEASRTDSLNDDITPFGPYSHSVEPPHLPDSQNQQDALAAYPSTNMPAIGIGVSLDNGDTRATEEESSNVAVLRGARPTR